MHHRLPTSRTAAFYFHNGETPGAVVDGFTIKNGNAYYGGAIECEEASPTIDNCIITNNIAAYGGAIDFFYTSSVIFQPVIKNCIITNNSSDSDGGAIECSSESSPEITNCLIAGNTADGYGAIDCYDESSPEILNCTIADNTGYAGRGGVHATNASSPTIRNCIIWNNGDDILRHQQQLIIHVFRTTMPEQAIYKHRPDIQKRSLSF